MNEPLLVQCVQGIDDGKGAGLELDLIEKRQLKLLHVVAHRPQLEKRVDQIDLTASEHYVTVVKKRAMLRYGANESRHEIECIQIVELVARVGVRQLKASRLHIVKHKALLSLHVVAGENRLESQSCQHRVGKAKALGLVRLG